MLVGKRFQRFRIRGIAGFCFLPGRKLEFIEQDCPKLFCGKDVEPFARKAIDLFRDRVNAHLKRCAHFLQHVRIERKADLLHIEQHAFKRQFDLSVKPVKLLFRKLRHHGIRKAHKRCRSPLRKAEPFARERFEGTCRMDRMQEIIRKHRIKRYARERNTKARENMPEALRIKNKLLRSFMLQKRLERCIDLPFIQPGIEQRSAKHNVILRYAVRRKGKRIFHMQRKALCLSKRFHKRSKLFRIVHAHMDDIRVLLMLLHGSAALRQAGKQAAQF